MFFERQFSQECGLHAIHNMFKSAAVTRHDVHGACESIQKKTGDSTSNHESYSGDWSCEAILETIRNKGYVVERAVYSSKSSRVWSEPPIEDLINEDDFRGMIVYQPFNRHFTCVRPETISGEKYLYYVDSMARGPIRISPRLVTRRCLSKAYKWEPYIVKGPEMEFVPIKEYSEPMKIIDYCSRASKRQKFTPSSQFLKAWKNTNTKSSLSLYR